MVSIADMTAHYRQAFDDHQAKVLADATVQIEADLVRREDFFKLIPDNRRLIADSDAWLAFPSRLVVPGYIAAGGLGGPGAVSLVRASDFDGKGVTREAAIQARSTSNGHARRTREPHPAQRPVAFRISSVRMIATPISDSPAISPLDTGTV